MKYELPVDYTKLTAAQRKEVRNQYIVEQNNLCIFCGCALNIPPPKSVTEKYIDWSLFPPGFLKYPIHLQHHHKTNLTEGACHNYCNAVAFQYYGR